MRDEDMDEPGPGTREGSELAELLQVRIRADRALALRYGRLARFAYVAGFAALALALALWALGVLDSSQPLLRVLALAGVVFLVVGALVAKLAETVANRRRSTPRRGSEDPPS